MMHHNVVEISSDEEEDIDDGQPESSRGGAYLTPTGKRSVVIDSDDEDLGTQLDFFYRFLEPAHHKRQKFEHEDSVDEAKGRFDADDFMDYTHSPLEQQEPDFDHLTPSFTKVDISFNALDAGDSRATLSFRPVPCPEAAKDVSRPKADKQPERQGTKPGKTITQEDSRPKLPPYYYDTKLETHMYRGPGFEKFPVVLGHTPEHQDICHEWDLAEARRSIRQQRKQAYALDLTNLVDDTFDVLNSGDEEVDMLDQNAMELECLQKIREVLPDVQRDFALVKIREHMKNSQDSDPDNPPIRPNPALILSHILESSDYPKQEKCKKVSEPAADGTGVTIEWQKGHVESKTYQRDAVCLLATQFDHVPTHYIYKTVQDQKSMFESYQHIHKVSMAYDKMASKERPYRRSTNPRQLLEKKYASKERELRSKEQWEMLVNELQAARQKVERERLQRAKEEDRKVAELLNLEEHRVNGNIVECQCCFDDEIPINRAVSCENHEMHWFCFDCVFRLAENQVGSMKYEMACMHQSGCKASLSREGVGSAIPERLCDKLAFYQQQHEITAACIEGLEQCPFCDFKAICDPIEESSIFQCQNPDCGRVTCRKCHEDSHVPKSCEEFKNDRQISARHQVEEARSEAMMRTCPKCKVKIIKELGCNKMVCGRCGCLMCYVCREDISGNKDGGYNHFGKVGSKCSLHDKNSDRHDEEADEAEKVAIKKVQAEHADIDEKQLQVETGKPRKKKSVAPNLNGLPDVGWDQRFLPPILQPDLPPPIVGVERPDLQVHPHRPGRRWFGKAPKLDRRAAERPRPIHVDGGLPLFNGLPNGLPARQPGPNLAAGRNHNPLFHVFPAHQPYPADPQGPLSNDAAQNFRFPPIRPPNPGPLQMPGELAYPTFDNDWAWGTNAAGLLGDEAGAMMPLGHLGYIAPDGHAHNMQGAQHPLRQQYGQYVANPFARFDRIDMNLGVQNAENGTQGV